MRRTGMSTLRGPSFRIFIYSIAAAAATATTPGIPAAATAEPTAAATRPSLTAFSNGDNDHEKNEDSENDPYPGNDISFRQSQSASGKTDGDDAGHADRSGTPEHKSFRKDEMGSAVYPPEILPAGECLRARPDIFRRSFTEDSLVTFPSRLIPALELRPFRIAALRRAVMERKPEDPATEAIPVALGVAEVQMPHMIYRVRRRYRMPRLGAKNQKTFVFVNGPGREPRRPSILSGQPS